jgi:hypothetical protein
MAWRGWRGLIAAAILATTSPCRADEPSVCDVAPSTITFALGAYRGPYLVTFADGTRLGHTGWQSCPPAPPGRERSWEGCNFSLCDLQNGRYQINFADPPAAPTFRFAAKLGRISLDPSNLGLQVGFYGVDATGSHVNLTLDLRGYTLPWSIAHWPGPFHGNETHGRAVALNGQLVFSLFPGVPYAFRFGTATATVTLDGAGAITAEPGGPLTIQGRTAILRASKITIAPPEPGAWSLNDTNFDGPQTVALPAGASVTLHQGNVQQSVALDASCHATITVGLFKLAPSAAQSCGP